jgi:hypothetical protein
MMNDDYLYYVDNHSINQLRFKAYYNFLKSITCLKLGNVKYSLNKVSGSTIDYLPHFTNRTDLYIDNAVDRNLTLFDLLNT